MAEDVFLQVFERGGGPSSIGRRQLASATIKKGHAHDSQGKGIENGWGVKRGAGNGGRANWGWIILSGDGVLGSEQVVATVT